jgi:hypothetical protein
MMVTLICNKMSTLRIQMPFYIKNECKTLEIQNLTLGEKVPKVMWAPLGVSWYINFPGS